MRLKFFEKNEIKPVTVVTSNDSNLSGNLNVLSSTQKQSAKQGKSFRSILKKLVHYPFYTEGTRGTGSFKINDVSRGEGEITSRSQGRSSTKSLTATFDGTGTIQRSQVLQNLSYNFSVPRLRLEPILDASITDSDGETTTRLANGFVDPNYAVIKNIASLDSIIVGGSNVNVFGSEGQVNESKVEDIDETFTTPKTATVRYTDSAGDIVHEEVSMDLPYRLRGETWEVFDKVGVALREQSASRFISQIMRQTIELRGVDLEMQLDPLTTILPNMTDFDPRPFTIARTSTSLVFVGRRATNVGADGTTIEDTTEAFRTGDGSITTLSYRVDMGYTITASGKAQGNFSFSGTASFEASIQRTPALETASWSVIGQSRFFNVSDAKPNLEGFKAQVTTAFNNNINLSTILNPFVDEFNENEAERINRLIVNLQDNAIRQRTPFDAPDSQIYNVNTTATTTTGQNIGTHDLRDLALPSFKARPFEVTGGDNKTLGTSQVLLNRKSVALLTNQTYSPSSIETFVGSASEEARKQKLGFQDLVTFDPDEIPLVDRQGRALSREIINENFLPITATKTINGDEVTFSLIAIVKETGTDNLVQLWQRSDGANVTASNLSGLTYRMLRADGTIRTEEVISTSRGNHVFNGVTYQSFSSNLTNLLTFVYLNFTDFGDTLNIVDAREKLYSDAVNVAIDFSGATAGEEEQSTTFNFDTIDVFPDVSIDLSYLEASNQLRLVLNRNHEFAPIPDKAFFDSMTINNRTFSFSGSSYSSDEDTGDAIYLFSSSTPPISDTAETFDITFTKTGESFTRAFDIERVVKKSTIRQEQSKDLPRIVNGLKLSDISFGDDFFEIEFDEVNLSASSFDCIQILSGSQEVTRQMRSSDATISGGNTFRWEGLEEFKEIKKNKTYTLEILKGGYCEVDKLFIPNPSGDYHFIENMAYADGKLSFNLRNNTSSPLSDNPFNSIRIIQSSVTFLSPKVFSDFFIEDGAYTLETPLSFTNGTYDFYIEVEDLPLFSLTLTQLTDFVFDTIVIQDTNIDQLSITDQLNRELIHPSDIREIKAITEGGERGFVIFLNNPVVSPVINLNNRSVFNKTGQRNFGKVFLFKQIGSFTKFPLINVFIDSTKTTYKTQTGQTHVKTLPESFRYSLDFGSSPLDQVSDLRLAEDLFSRLSDYNEFVVWVNGGVDTSSNKFNNMKGFRFKDIVQVLTTNNWSYRFQEGRLSSGLNFVMEISEVPL